MTYGLYQKALLQAHPDAAWALRHFQDGPDQIAAVEQALLGDPWLQMALSSVADCETPDEASAILSKLADDVEASAIASRGDPYWADKAIAMGRLRTAAANVWDARPPALGR